MTATVRIGGHEVGAGQPCYVIAEIGINHNGDMALAERSIAAAAAAGADAVKFQNYRTEDFISDRSLTYSYVSQGKPCEEAQFDLFKRCELSPAALRALRQVAAQHNLDFVSTPTGPQGVDDLAALGAAAVKNGSDYLGNVALIRHMARSGLPTILSVGMATLAEVDDAVRSFREAGGTDLVLLHCVSIYPAPASSLHLRKIPAMAAAFGCPIGFSDHTEGIVAAAAAVAIGAAVVEKHFTLDRTLPGPDHAMSCDPQTLAELVRAVRDTQVALGSGALGYSEEEAAPRQQHRLSCVAADDLPCGHRLREQDIAFRRPGSGIPPAMVAGLLGRSLSSAVRRGQVLGWTDFE
jgi:sialic acid synthase SpsE